MGTSDDLHAKVVDLEERWDRLAECFSQLGADPQKNINILTALSGSSLGGASALYNRLCGDKLVSWGQWQIPEDYNPVDNPEGHICYDVITSCSNDIYLVRDLLTSPYAESDPNVKKYQLQTYIGTAAKVGTQCVGSLCVVFQHDFIPSKADRALLGIISRAIGVEEKRLQAEGNLQQSHQRLLLVLNSLEAIVHVADLETHEILFMNQYAQDIFGSSLGKKCWEVFQGKKTGPCDFCLDPRLAVKGRSVPREMQNCINGRWYNMLDRSIEWLDRRVVRLHLSVDITERKQAEMALKESSDKFLALADMLPGFIAYVNATTLQYEFVNAAYEKSFGIPRERIIGSHIKEIIGEKNYQFALKFIDEVRSGKSVSYENTFNLVNGTRWIQVNYSPVIDANGQVASIAVLTYDITERKKAEEDRLLLEQHLLYVQKQESLGGMAGGIAHDFNNLLMAIMANTDLALLALPAEAPVREQLLTAKAASLRAADLCKQMLVYAGQGSFSPVQVDLSRVIEESQHLLEVSVAKKSCISLELTKDLPTIDADPIQLRQMLVNIVTNAGEAITTGGCISVKTHAGPCEATAQSFPYHAEFPFGLCVTLQVTDNGCGMDAETVNRIFDPFFSTKFAGRGLGLAAVLGIVRAHHGEVMVESTPGQGTTVSVSFPVSKQWQQK